jgi:hypothetical protein
MDTSKGIKTLEGGSAMNDLNCTLCKLLLNAMSHAAIAAVLIRIASSYRYVQVFM